MGDHSVEIRAKTRVRAGEEITNQYMAPDTPTYLRCGDTIPSSVMQLCMFQAAAHETEVVL